MWYFSFFKEAENLAQSKRGGQIKLSNKTLVSFSILPSQLPSLSFPVSLLSRHYVPLENLSSYLLSQASSHLYCFLFSFPCFSLCPHIQHLPSFHLCSCVILCSISPPLLSLQIISPLFSALLSPDVFQCDFPPSLPSSLPSTAGGRFWGSGGDDLAVDGAQQQHEPNGSKHLGGRYPMRLRDGYIQDCCCHCVREKYRQITCITTLKTVKLSKSTEVVLR